MCNIIKQRKTEFTIMPNYQNAKIYTIRSHQTEQIYIGSTTQSLANRLCGHKCDLKNGKVGSSKEIIKYDDAYIELLEEFPCDNKQQLCKREGFHIRKNNCVNKQIAGRTREEYRKDNDEHLTNYYKNYRINNKENKKEYDKKYEEENKEHKKQYRKQYYKKNYEINKDVRICVCGVQYNYGESSNRKQHYRSKFHQSFTEEFKIRLQEYLS